MEHGMAHTNDVWWRPEGRSPFALDPAKPRTPQIVSAILQFGVIFGGPALGLFAIAHYPPLVEDRIIYFDGIASISLCFSLSFLLFSDKSFPKGMPMSMKLVFRAGFGLCVTFLLLGIGGIANGYRTPIIERPAAVVAKHETLQRDPAHRAHYVAVRAWSGSKTVVELDASREVYDRLNVPVTAIDTPEEVLERMPDDAQVELSVGQGRLGLEWLKAISLP
jgi:hypothetical protein